MTENKMTEAEIMNALECAVMYQTTDVRTYKGIPIEVFSKAVLDLLNRKNAVNERLTVTMNAFGLGMKRESERAETARAEAIKEFIATLKSKKGLESFCGYRIFDWELDQIAKEMGVEL